MCIWVLLIVYIRIMYFRHKIAQFCVNTTRVNNLNRTEVIPDESTQYGVERTGFLWRNIQVPSHNHCFIGKAISITYSECVFVALGVEHAMRMRRVVLSLPVLLYRVFPHYLINGTIFGGGRGVTEHKIFVLIFSKSFVWNISHSNNNSTTYYHKFTCSTCKVHVTFARC